MENQKSFPSFAKETAKKYNQPIGKRREKNIMAKTNAEKRLTLYRVVSIGLMAALVYVGNFMEIRLNNDARVHLGNSMCLLAGLLFGGVNGGLSSGIGGALYDLFNPAYVMSAPYTFFSKFSMGFVSGKLNRNGMKNEFLKTLIAAVCGQITYIILYLGKSFIEQLLLGNPIETATGVMVEKGVTSLINGTLAVIIAVPLSIAIKKALRSSGFKVLLEEKSESKGYFNPVTIFLTIFAIIVTAGFGIRLSAEKKIRKAEEEKAIAYQQQIDELNEKIDYLYEKLEIEENE